MTAPARRIAGGCAACLIALTAQAQLNNAELGTEIRYSHATTLKQPVETLIELRPALEGRMSPDIGFTVSGRIRLDAQDDLAPGRASDDSYDTLSRPITLGRHGTAELRDAHVDLDIGPALLRLGKQQIVWGSLDGVKVLDVVNPQSFREFILDDFGASRIGLWSALLDVPLGNWRLEIAAVPDATTHEIPQPGAFFELTAPRFRFGAPTNAPALPSIRKSPGSPVNDGLAGARLSRWGRGFDLQLVALSGLDHEPLGRLVSAPDGAAVELYHQRRDLFGFSVQLAAGPITVRTEVSYQPERRFNIRDDAGLGTLDLAQWRGAVGLDVNGPWDVFVNAQYLYDTIEGRDEGLIRPRTERLATLFLRRSFAYETIRTELRWYGSTTRADGVVRAAVSYALTENATIELAADAFYGRADGPFGQFADRDRITVALTHTF